MTALRRTMPAAWAHVGAMQIVLEARDIRVVGEYLTIIDLAPTHGRPVVCCINGEYISRADWWQPVRCGDVVVFAEVAAGGNTGRLIGLLAVAAAAVFAPALATGVYTALGGTFVSASAGTAITGIGAALGAGVSVFGGLLVNALFPVAGPQTRGGSQVSSPTYSVGLQGNRPRVGQAVPVRFGQEMFYPDLICPDYNDFASNGRDQHYHAGLSIGLGEYNVLQIYIDDTPLQSFESVQAYIVGPGMSIRAQPTGYTGVETFADQSIIETGMITSVEVTGQDMLTATWVGPFAAIPAGFSVNRIYIDMVWPRGVGTMDNDGDINNRSISWQVQAQPIDNAGSSLGDWVMLGTETYTANTSLPQRRSYSYDVTAGRYRVRVRRITARSDNNRHLNDMQWAQMRARLNVPGVARDDVTGIALRIRSSSQLTALTQRRVRVLAQRLVPVWDGSDWSEPEFSRNPAWALADIWRNDVYGRGLSDDRIDLESLEDYAAVWATRQDRFDYSFDNQLTTDEAAQTVASAGRARTMLRRGAVHSLVRDEAQDEEVAVIMPRNIDADSFSLRWALATSQTPDCVACTYRDGQVWSDRTVYAQIYAGVFHVYTATATGQPLRPGGVPPPTLIEDWQLAGVIGEKQAIRQAVYLLARMLYRREEGGVQQDLDALLAAVGSAVGIAHDATQWGQSGDVVEWSSGTLTLTVTEPIVWTAGQTHYVRLQKNDGSLGGAIEVTPGATDYEMILAESPAFTLSTNSPDRERTRYLFGALADVQRQAIVVSLRPSSEDSVETTFFIEDRRVHEVDRDWLPVGAEIQDPLNDGAILDDDDAAEDTFVEDFEVDLVTNYTSISGSFGTFTRETQLGTQALNIASINVDTPHRIRRALPATVTLEELSVRFMMPVLSEDDAGVMRLYAGSTIVLSFNPKRDQDFDDNRRPKIVMNRYDSKAGHIEKSFPTGGPLAAATWYELRVLVTPGNAGSSATIVRIDDNEVMASVQIASGSTPSDYSGIVLTHLEWVADSGGDTTETVYDDLIIFSLEP